VHQTQTLVQTQILAYVCCHSVCIVFLNHQEVVASLHHLHCWFASLLHFRKHHLVHRVFLVPLHHHMFQPVEWLLRVTKGAEVVKGR